MTDADISFRKLLHPIPPEEFFAHAQGRLAVHIPGPRGRFAAVFSWKEFNRLLNQASLWSDHNTTMVLDGHDVTSEEFCVPGTTRQGNQAMLPDPRRVAGYLQRGATLVLDLMERLSPGVAAVAASLEAVTGSPVVCNAYCSFNAHQGFSSHFDSTDVFVLHIEGEKTWRLYEGRFEHPLQSDYARLPPEQHAQARGKLLKEVLLTPGDVLYIPRGQYHDAVASSEACLHLTFGIVPRTGHDFLTVLLRSLDADPLFREALPHLDDVQAYRAHLRRLAQRLGAIIQHEQTIAQARQQHRQRTFRDALRSFDLPARPSAPVYRVRWRDARLLMQQDGRAVLQTPSGEHALSAPEYDVARWALERDYFEIGSLQAVCHALASTELETVVAKLASAGLLERM
jgi:bifunctional lysine-specific demethylase and histidyl-hydroxylase MINA